MTRIWIGNDFELRAKSRGDSTNWAAIPPISLPNLPAQAPKRSNKQLDVIEKRTPITPLPTDNQASPNITTYNRFDLLEVDITNQMSSPSSSLNNQQSENNKNVYHVEKVIKSNKHKKGN